MSKKKLIAIIVPCVIASIAIIVTIIYLPTLTREDIRKPEQVAVSAYDFADQLFNPELTDMQRENLWEDYEGKQVRWISELKDAALEKGRLVVTFLNPLDSKRTEVVAVFDESQESSLLEFEQGDLVIYVGVLASFEKDEIHLRHCTIVSFALIHLWWNGDIETRNKRILVGDEVLCLGPGTHDDATLYHAPNIAAINIETGELLWEGNRTRSVLVGIDSRYIYACSWDLRLYDSYSWFVQSNIEALDKVSGQIAWTARLPTESIYCPDYYSEHEFHELPLSDCLHSKVVGGSVKTEITNHAESGLILLMNKLPLYELAYGYEGVIYKSGSASYGGIFGVGREALQAINPETGGILWIATFGYKGMIDFSIVNGMLYVSTDKGVGAFRLSNLTDLQNPNSSETGI
jgi:hypothetical protein